MTTKSAYPLEAGFENPPWQWLETGAITLGPLVLLAVLRPEDPLLLTTEFPWLVLIPLLVGLRYGFLHGLVSGLTIALSIGIGAGFASASLNEGFPSSRIVGILVVGMLAGEFSDRWLRRVHALRALGRYRQRRLEEFSRAYHLLKISHDRLDEQIAGNATSLRGALLGLRERLRKGSFTGFAEVGDVLMGLFADQGRVQVAGLHEVDASLEVLSEPAASLGAARSIDPSYPIVRKAIETRGLVTVREVPEASGPLAVLPLEDVEGRLRGVLVIHEMRFVAFTEAHLHLMMVLGGHVADLLLSGDEGNPPEQEFQRALRRSHRDVRRYGLDASLVSVEVGPKAVQLGVHEVLGETKRSLDHALRKDAKDGRIFLFFLMALTDGQGAQGYEQRVRCLLRERFAGAVSDDDIVISSWPLVRNENPIARLDALRRQCGFEAR